LAAQIVAGLDAEVHVIERNGALLMPPASLDAWQAYHRGRAHMYRFTSDSNREAQQFFTRAIALDPTFSRSYAGLSFTHFQNAFLLQAREREREIALASETAGQACRRIPATRQHIARSVERYGFSASTTAPLASSVNPFV